MKVKVIERAGAVEIWHKVEFLKDEDENEMVLEGDVIDFSVDDLKKKSKM